MLIKPIENPIKTKHGQVFVTTSPGKNVTKKTLAKIRKILEETPKVKKRPAQKIVKK